MKNNNSSGRLWRNVLIGLALVVVYAYAIQATKIDLEEPFKPTRQNNLIGLVRSLARPDLFKFEGVTRSNNISLRMPCPEEIKGSQVTFEGRTMVLAPNCVSTTQDVMTLTGSGFPPYVRGAVQWHPPGESATARRLTEFRADADGNFRIQFTTPDVRPSEEPQRIEVIEVLERNISGLSEASKITIEKIIETVLMALMASTIGTILAVPVSFMAARNLMTDVGTPLASLGSALILAPIGGIAGWLASRFLVGLSVTATSNSLIGVVVVLVAAGIGWFSLRQMSVASDEGPSSPLILLGRGLLTVLVLVFTVAALAQLGLVSGAWLDERLGIFGFVGNFIYVASDVVRVLLPLMVGLVAAAAAASAGSRFGQNTVMYRPTAAARTVTTTVVFLGTTVLLLILLYSINWICVLGVCRLLPESTPELLLTLLVPSALVGLLAAGMSMRVNVKKQFPTGTVTYTLIRGLLNTLRAIEPVIMGIVFVVWVGLGPFAGILALTLHSVADLGKLFSEQVENIDEGPLEAVTATGANRFQSIVFAVVPQIVPHYVAFTFYRWDINVRMSTIIGFVGGGGIGMVLQRHTNLTQYRQAAVMVIAIAVVVTVLDYVSSKIRSRII